MAVGSSLIGVMCFLTYFMSGESVSLILFDECRSGEGHLMGLLLTAA